MKKHLYLTCIFFALYIHTNAQDTSSLQQAFSVADQLYKSYAEKNHFPGMVYGIVKDGKLVYTGASGLGNIGKQYPVNATTCFRIASMTKSFVSVAILQLRDAGKLKLDDPAYLYIPELKSQHYLTTDAPLITIRHLLTHAAGFPEDNPWGDRQLAVTDQEMLDMIKKGISFSNVPGVAYEYSNMGFAMLGYIIKKVTGMHYADYITQHILQPLGMKHTYFEYTNVPEARLAHGYRWLNDTWIEQPMLHDGAYGAMGGMITTMEDFAKYVAFQLQAWPARDGKEEGLLKRSSLREMQQPWNFNNLNSGFHYPGGSACPVVSAYGYGLRWSKDCKEHVFVGHTGGLPGFGSNWAIVPDYGIGVICFANLTYAPASAINAIVLDTLISLARLKPGPIPVSTIINQRKEELVKLLPEWKGVTSSDIFAVNFFMDYMIDSLKKEAGEVYAKAGRVLKVRPFIPENNLRGGFIMEGENANIEIRFTLTPEQPARIQEYHIRSLPK